MNKISINQIESFLLESADILRGNLDASEFKDYIFSIMFLKRISDAFDEEVENCIHELKNNQYKLQKPKGEVFEEAYHRTG